MTGQAPHSSDVVIIGGGVIGSAVAYFLGANADFNGHVTVVEMDPSYQFGTTGRSVAGLRLQFSTPENIACSRFGIDFVRHVADFLSLAGEAPALSYRERGYLSLATPEGAYQLRENRAVQQSAGVDNLLLDKAGLAERFPWMCADDLEVACFGHQDEGWVDPHALLQGFRRKAQSLGAVYLEDRVTGLELSKGQVCAVTLASGDRIACGQVVNAAGARSRDIAAMVGVDLDVWPRKRQVFVFSCRSEIPNCPLVFDPSGLYFRPEGNFFLT
ncbi:MAG: FAD-dependent oxidoreductase, partial [Pseudomonadota bacterium]